MQAGQLTFGTSTEMVADFVSMAWSTFVGVDVAAVDEAPVPEHPVCASISINGPWAATLLLYCEHDVAVQSTASVLGMDPSEVDPADVLDIMGELANIIGGNLKGAISDENLDWKLSLPVVSDGMQTVTGSKLATALGFVCPWGAVGCEIREHA